MARIRSVHPSICISEDMALLSAEVERTFVRLWTHCDDAGRCRDNMRLIKAAIYPLHDDMTVEVINDHIDELVEHGHLVAYEVGDKTYLQVVAWHDYQHPQRASKSKLPSPDEGSCTPRGTRAYASRQEGRGVEMEGSTRERAALPLELVPVRPSSADADGVSDFDAWWATYPRKVDKAKARAAYLKARKRVGSEVLASSLARQNAVWKREGRPTDKVPHATTWLNGERWDDEDLTDTGVSHAVNELGQVER